MTEQNKETNLHEISGSSNIKNLGWMQEFPFKSVLSFKHLIEFWEKEAASSNNIKAELAKKVLSETAKIPEIREPLKDFSLIERNPDLIEMLMSVIYPPAQWNSQISASCVPFQFKTFYSTPIYKTILDPDGSFNIHSMGIDEKEALFGKILSAYLIIFKLYYGVNLKTSFPVIARLLDQSTGLYKYYNVVIDPGFVKPVSTGAVPPLSEEDKKRLLKDPTNLKLWMQLIPPEKFEFHGFVTYTAVDINDQEIISSLKNDLIEKEAIFSSERISSIEEKLRSLFNISKLKLGLAAIPRDWSLMADYARRIGNSFIMNDLCMEDCSEVQKSVYNKVYQTGKPVIVEDLEKCEFKTRIEKKIIEQGIKNILIAPLYYKEEPIGILELGSPNKGDINPLNSVKVKEILSLFAVAVKRSIEEFESEIQKLIKENCTAIHPVVEWKFRRAAVKVLLKKEDRRQHQMEPIIFENVYPLYGLTDIRDSSENRNRAIQNDLVEHLNVSKNILKRADEMKPLPLFKEMEFRIDKYVKRVKVNLNSAEEITINEFLQNEIEPAFGHIRNYSAELDELVTGYFASLDPVLHAYYYRRKDYEESVELINETISNYLDEAQADAQKMYPHYFEKYKSDGVEHSIYVGNSLVEEGKFDMIYLRNLRLWQLIAMCRIAQKLEELKKEMKTPLQSSHLILVQNNPLSIRFRFDEKKFDVDGTYNLRYEIMKKRIDKALIKGTNERLTQPGKIAVIFSQPREAKEYKRYFEYLAENGYLENKTEELEVEDLQGVYGLKALRVSVSSGSKTENIKARDFTASKRIKELINNPV